MNKKFFFIFRYSACIIFMLAGALTAQAADILATASTDDGNVPSNTLDGSLGTRWSAFGEGNWIQYDLGSSQTLDSVNVAFFKGDQRTAKISIDASSDANSWTRLFSGEQSALTTELQRFDVDNTESRYVRITGFGNSSNRWNSLTEVEFETLLVTNKQKLDSQNWSLSSDTNSGNIYNAIDGNINSRWSTGTKQTPGQEFIINLNQNVFFDRVVLNSENSPNDYPRGYKVQTSNNGNSWETVASGTSFSAETVIDFEDQKANFIRIEQTGSDSYYWWSIHELSVYSNSNTNTFNECGFSLEEMESQANLPSISVNNLEPNEVIPHQMVMFVGNTSSPVDSVTVVHNGSTTVAPAAVMDFKAFAILEPGLNYVGLKAEGHKPLCFPIAFDEPENEFEVRYFSYTAVDSKDDVFMYTPANAHLNNVYSCLDDDPCDKQTIADRMRFMALINQMLFAETIVASGGPRQTFTLARDENGEVLNPLFVSDKTAAEMVQIVDDSGESRGSYVMMTQVAGPDIDDYIRSLGLNLASIKQVMIFRDVLAGAWGGGRRASLGAGTFNTWAADLPEFYERLYDLRNPLEHGPLWTNTHVSQRTVSRSYTSNIGALMHEIGHALGLPHPIAPQTCAMMGGGGGGSARMDQILLAGIVPTNICWTTNNNHEPARNHFESVLGSPWIKGVGE